MQQVIPAPPLQYGIGYLMPVPSPLGRLVRRRRLEMGLTQDELADLVGAGMTQNQISRLESGKTQGVNDAERLTALGKALGLDSDVDFVIAAYAPKGTQVRHVAQSAAIDILPPGPEGEIIALVRRPDVNKRRALDILRAAFPEEPQPAK